LSRKVFRKKGIKNAEFYTAFKTVAKIAKKLNNKSVINKEVREICCFSIFSHENNSFGGQHFSTLPELKSAENFASFDTLLDIFLK
jgi:hypothetical protein